MIYILIAVLFIIIFALITKLILMKKDIKKIVDVLDDNFSENNNRQATLNLIDKDLTNLTAKINESLYYQKHLQKEQIRIKDDLKQSISDIAHDLRTPLTVISGNLQMVDEKNMGENDANHLEICKKQIGIVRNMVDEFFEMSVFESDTEKVELSKVNITNQIVQFVIDHEPLITSNGLEPKINLPEKTVNIYANQQLLDRMLSNLLNNIVKYAHNTFSIDVSAVENICKITFSNKIEIGTTVDTDRMFNRNYRASKERKGNSAGLGLYIVKLLADKQDAKVYATQKDDMLFITMEFREI